MSAVNASLPQQSPEDYSDPRPSEPSMEDILASIRRIIADDQSRNAAALATFKRAGLREDEPPTEPVARNLAPEAEGRIPAAVVKAAGPSGPIEAVPAETIAETQAPAVVPEAPAPELIDQIASVAAAAILRPRFAATQPPDPIADGGAGQPDKSTQSAPAESHAVTKGDVPHPEVSEMDDNAAWQPDHDGEPLVSPEAGADVESSLQAYAASVFLQNTDQVENIVREMLRPMLKTWLDANLPRMVERMVSAEIERVARGMRPNP